MLNSLYHIEGIKIAVIQSKQSVDKMENLRNAEKLVHEAAKSGATLIVLPVGVKYSKNREIC